jgi:hypothetical protein
MLTTRPTNSSGQRVLCLVQVAYTKIVALGGLMVSMLTIGPKVHGVQTRPRRMDF